MALPTGMSAWLLSIVSTMCMNDRRRSPATGRGVRLAVVTKAARVRNDVVSPVRLVASVCLPQCSELFPEKAIDPPAGVPLHAVVEPATCGAGQVPGGQWTC